MKIKTKKVYYCDFCKKHSLVSWSIKQHEKHCTLNPNRECGVCENKNGVAEEDIEFIKKNFDILMSHKKEGGIIMTFCKEFEDKVRELSNRLECPACAFSVLRQCGKEVLSWASYNYKDEMKKYWEEKNKEDLENDFYGNL